MATGDSVSLTMGVTLTPAGLLPRTRRLRVVGIFSLGLFEFDSTYGFVSLDVAKRLLGKDQVDLIQLRVDDIYAAPRDRAVDSRRRSAPSTSTQDWADMNQSLFSALWLEKIAISLTIGLIVMVAALNIVASLILLVMEKHRDIAILKTMGASAQERDDDLHDAGADHRRRRHGGRRVGGLRAVDGARPLQADPACRSTSTRCRTCRSRVLPLDFALVVVGAILVCFVATIYPSRQAARLDPVQALRYE